MSSSGNNPIQLCVLASGSTGNAIYIGTPQTRILIDAGLNAKQLALRLESIGVCPDSLHAICISHEHTDHVAGARVMHTRHQIDLYANSGTRDGIREEKARALPWKIFETGQPFHIGDLQLESFSVPHDSYEPVGFIVSCGERRIGIATDMGIATNLIRQKLMNCDALVLESNHCPRLLQECDRPWTLKQRIAGRQGHLSNEAAVELILEIAQQNKKLQRVFLAHLSRECNCPDLALTTARRALDEKGFGHILVEMTHQHKPCELCTL